uniref:Uncharacterized protein n=1 Tax=Picea glauca TaxID=3330 RepID=A0A101M0Q8_PICGL|nr:hypothetical protein ABT39_MTgene4240 [Picea glauca]
MFLSKSLRCHSHNSFLRSRCLYTTLLHQQWTSGRDLLLLCSIWSWS